MQFPPWYVIVGVVILLIAILYFVPKWQSKGFGGKFEVKFEIESRLRKMLVLIVGVFLVVASLLFTLQSLRLSRIQIEQNNKNLKEQLEFTRKQLQTSDSLANLRIKLLEEQLENAREETKTRANLSSRDQELRSWKSNMQLFDSATQVLDSRNRDQVSLEGKLNSIYVLTKLGLNDVNYHDIVLKTLATYIKINSPRTHTNSMAEVSKAKSDIAECLLAIGRIKDNWNSNISLDLSNTLLTSCKLDGNYNNVNFDKCNLNFSEIRNGTFLNASFINSFLVYAKITNSKFSNVSFYHSQMDQVEMRNVQFNNACDLRSANFTSSTFKNVDMSKIQGLKKSQFFSMVDSANFKLPKAIIN